MFEEGAYQSTDGEMAELKAWVMAQLMWDPKQDNDALVREFLKGYYGEAADSIYNYLQLVQKRAQEGPLSFAAPVSAKFLSYDTMHDAELLWEFAEMKVADNPTLLWRVQQAHLSVQYVWLRRWEEFRAASLAKNDHWLLDPSRKAAAQKWLKLATGPGPDGWTPLTTISEGAESPEQFVDRLGNDPAGG